MHEDLINQCEREGIAASDAATEHRNRLEGVEKRAPSREKFRKMMERFPAPDRWLDDNDDWDL